MNLSEALTANGKITETDNGAPAVNTTDSGLLDFYSNVGAVRTAPEQFVTDLFIRAYAEDPLRAMKALFYARDIRGGLGERKVFRDLLHFVAIHHPEAVECNMWTIGEVFGRFDDIFALEGTPLEDKMWKYLRKKLDEDIESMKAGKEVSLLAKWIPNPNNKVESTRKRALHVAKKLGFAKQGFVAYKKNLRDLRKHIDVVEVKLSNKQYEEIDYSKVPSKAMLKYATAFKRRDTDRYEEFMQKVESGEAKLNTGALSPYDIVHKLLKSGENPKELDTTWNNLPNYIEDEHCNILCMCDTSASMTWYGGRPYEVAAGLGIYFADRNNGPFAHKIMTFSSHPEFIELNARTLAERLYQYNNTDFGGSTNVAAAMRLIVRTGVKYGVSPEDMPKALVIISDMQFDPSYTCKVGGNFTESMKKLFEDNGYEMPNLVYWNVLAKRAVFHTEKGKGGVQLVSGESASVFKQLIKCLNMTPYEAMIDVLDSARYSIIRVA